MVNPNPPKPLVFIHIHIYELKPHPGRTYDPESINRQNGAFKLLSNKAPSSAFNSKTTRLLDNAAVHQSSVFSSLGL